MQLRREAWEQSSARYGGRFQTGQDEPFGGARASGTNDKAGSIWNLIRWVSPRALKETLVPPTEYRYPFMADE